MRSRDLKKARSVLKDLEPEGFDVGKGSRIELEKHVCRFFLERDAIRRIQKRRLLGVEIPVISVEDNIIFKAILQRGEKEGKHDLQDINEMVKHEKIDFRYLRKRIHQCQCEKRVDQVLRCLVKET